MGRGVLGDLHLVVGVQVLHNLHLLNVLGLAGTLGGCVAAGASARSSAFRIPSPMAALPAIKAGVLPRDFPRGHLSSGWGFPATRILSTAISTVLADLGKPGPGLPHGDQCLGGLLEAGFNAIQKLRVDAFLLSGLQLGGGNKGQYKDAEVIQGKEGPHPGAVPASERGRPRQGPRSCQGSNSRSPESGRSLLARATVTTSGESE